jgi:hypothetical protein
MPAATSSGSSWASSRMSDAAGSWTLLCGSTRGTARGGGPAARVAQAPRRAAGHLCPAGQPRPGLHVPVGVSRVERERRDDTADGVRGTPSITRKGLPSVSARTTQGTPPWPMSSRRAQLEQPIDHPGLARSAAEVQVQPRRLRRPVRDGLEAQVEHRSALDGEPRLVPNRLVGELRRTRAREARLSQLRSGGGGRHPPGSTSPCGADHRGSATSLSEAGCAAARPPARR